MGLSSSSSGTSSLGSSSGTNQPTTHSSNIQASSKNVGPSLISTSSCHDSTVNVRSSTYVRSSTVCGYDDSQRGKF